MVVHFAPTAGIVDALLSTRKKTEFAGLLVNTYKDKTGGTPLAVNFATEDVITLKKGKMVQVQFMKDELVSPDEDQLLPQKSGGVVQIKTASGVPPHEGRFRAASW